MTPLPNQPRCPNKTSELETANISTSLPSKLRCETMTPKLSRRRCGWNPPREIMAKPVTATRSGCMRSLRRRIEASPQYGASRSSRYKHPDVTEGRIASRQQRPKLKQQMQTRRTWMCVAAAVLAAKYLHQDLVKDQRASWQHCSNLTQHM